MEKTLFNQDLQFVEEFVLTKKSYKPVTNSIKSSQTVAQFFDPIFKDTWNAREYFYSLFLNRANKVLGFSLVSMGGLSGTVIDTRLILANALICGASSVILVHNHPSGNTQPSDADIKITEKFKKASDLMEIKTLDHFIYAGPGNYYSFADEGLIN